MATPKTNYLGQYNKYMGEFNKYAPYLNMFKGGNMGKDAVETELDYGISQIPGYGQAYQGVKLFNQATGGVNFNKMLGIKNPLSQLSSSVFGKKKTADEEAQQDPEYAKYMSMLSDTQNSNAAAERAALAKKQAIQPMQEKAIGDYMDILQNGLSSRQLAPIYGAGESRNRAIGASAEAGLAQQVTNRGMNGGVRAGLEASTQANRNALSADLNSRITGQQIASRPGMLGQAANLTMSMDNQAQQELAQAAMNRLNASQVGLSAYNANQQNERIKEQLSDSRTTARNTEMGALAGMFGPDILKGMQGLLKKGIKIPGLTSTGGVGTINRGDETFNIDAEGSNNLNSNFVDPYVPTGETVGETGFQTPFDPSAIGPTNRYNAPAEQNISTETNLRLQQVASNLSIGQTATLPEHPNVEFVKTIDGWKKRPLSNRSPNNMYEDLAVQGLKNLFQKF